MNKWPQVKNKLEEGKPERLSYERSDSRKAIAVIQVGVNVRAGVGAVGKG